MKHGKVLAFFLLCFFLLTACGRVQDVIASFTTAPTVEEVSQRVSDLAARGRVADALKEGEGFLASNPKGSFSLHQALAQLYAESGNPEAALRHLQKSMDGADLTPPEPLSPPPSVVSVEVDGAVARVGPDRVEAHAGSASASSPR